MRSKTSSTPVGSSCRFSLPSSSWRARASCGFGPDGGTEARTAKEALASDPRPPVVYLRSFGVDNQFLVASSERGARLRSHLNYASSVSPEQEMAFIMERIGPVVAIGKPGERLPELGAARLYVGDDEWREVVGNFINDAALVVIRAGETANLWWETKEALTRRSPERVIILALGPPGTFDLRATLHGYLWQAGRTRTTAVATRAGP